MKCAISVTQIRLKMRDHFSIIDATSESCIPVKFGPVVLCRHKSEKFGNYNHPLSLLMFCKNEQVEELTVSLKGMAMMSNQKVLNPQNRRTFIFVEYPLVLVLFEKIYIRLSTPEIYAV